MARYKGPLFKKSRRYQFSVLENDNEFNKNKGRSSVPGQHGQNRPGKLSDYGLHLREKQKVKFTYGVNERQFVNTFKKAKKIKGVVGVNFLIRLESRLDNLVYRLGFANTRRQARQLVNHNHFLVDGKKANIPSMIIKLGQKIEVKPKSQEVKIINLNLETRPTAPWVNRKDFVGIYERFPERQELNPNIDEGLIVEFYSR